MLTETMKREDIIKVRIMYSLGARLSNAALTLLRSVILWVSWVGMVGVSFYLAYPLLKSSVYKAWKSSPFLILRFSGRNWLPVYLFPVLCIDETTLRSNRESQQTAAIFFCDSQEVYLEAGKLPVLLYKGWNLLSVLINVIYMLMPL